MRIERITITGDVFPDQLSLGEVLKSSGQARVDEAESEAWKEAADRAIAYLARTGRDFTAADVRKMAGDPSRENAIGSRFSKAAKAGLIQCVGITTADRASRHAGALRIWRGV